MSKNCNHNKGFRDPVERRNLQSASDRWERAPETSTVDTLVDAIPSDPQEFAWTMHVGHRVFDEDRLPAYEHVEVVLDEKNLAGYKKKGYRFCKLIDGVRIYVVVGFDGGMMPALLTAFPEVVDYERARLSNRFDKRAVLHSRAQNLLDGSDMSTDGWRSLLIGTHQPFPYEGHDLVTWEGTETARCLSCEEMFYNAAQIKRTGCH